MSLRVSFISVVVLLVLLAGCSTSPSGGVVINQEPTGPREIIVNSTPAAPAAQPTAPAATPAPAPAPVQHIPINVLPQQPAPEVYIVPADHPPVDRLQSCLDGCELKCKQSAAVSCRQTTGTACKANCGDIIDPSACSIACSLRDARSCEPKFKEFCGAQCVKRCY